jgi:hypothetical protein
VRLVALVSVLTIGTAESIFRHGARYDGDFYFIAVMIISLVVIPEFLLLAWFGVNLTPTHAVVNSIRRDRVSWGRVQAVVEEPFLGGRRVVLWTDEGRRIPLRAPIVDFTSVGARRFDRDFHTIGQWWLQHRGPDWQPSS